MFRTKTASPPELPQKTLQIKQDDKFFSRLLSKESSIANPSFRVYYGDVPVAVPFVWESQPGTSKYRFCEDALPPLTPPPSYYSHSNKKPIKKQYSRSNLLHMLFPGIISLKKSSTAAAASTLSPTPSSPSWSSSSNSSSFLALTPRKYHDQRSRFSSRGSSFDSRLGDEEPVVTIGSSPNSTLCFAASSRRTNGSFPGCYAWC